MQDEFEDFMDRRARELKGEWFDGKVAGITFPNPDGTDRQEIAATLSPYDELQLVPEPLNPFDPKAVAVMTPAGLQVGYLEGRLAAEYARRAKRGGISRCFVRAIRRRGQFCGVSFGLATTPSPQ